MSNWVYYFFSCALWFISLVYVVCFFFKTFYKGEFKKTKIKLFLLIIDSDLTAKDIGFKDKEQETIDNGISKIAILPKLWLLFRIFVSVFAISFSSSIVLLYPLNEMQYFEVFFNLLSAFCAAYNFVFLGSKSKFFTTFIVMFYTFSQFFIMIHKLGSLVSNIVFLVSLVLYLVIMVYSTKKLIIDK